MSNSLVGNIWHVDTASATPIIAAGTWKDIRRIQWIGGTTAGHECVVTDTDGRVLFRRLAAAVNSNFEMTFEGRFGQTCNGLIVPTLASGVVYIHFTQGE